MRTFIKTSIVLLLVCCNYFICLPKLQAQTNTKPTFKNLPLEKLSEFKKSSLHWKIAGDIVYDFNKTGRSEIGTGTGILVNTKKTKDDNILVSKLEHGNLAIEFEFMLAKESSATIYLQGRYGIKLNDSWGNQESLSNASGGILKKTDSNSNQSNVILPVRMNVCRAPGLWQKIQIFFQGPKFNDSGNKSSNAKFLKVIYNGVTIHENIELSGPSVNSPLNREAVSGSWVFSSEGEIALKNINYLGFENDSGIYDLLLSTTKENINDRQIVITPSQKTIVQRCFIEYDHKKRTFCVAVGSPNKIHYAMDLSQGALINFWKGEFIDATSMWTERGEHQIAVPLGSNFEIPPIPGFAALIDDKEKWPEKQSDKFKFKGYKIADNGQPTFLYSIDSTNIEDKIIPQEDGKFLTRTFKIISNNATNTIWLKLAEGNIKPLGQNMFSINGNSYYIKFENNQNLKAILRNSNLGQELIVPLSGLKNQKEIKYSIIW